MRDTLDTRDPNRSNPALRTSEVLVVVTSIDDTFAAARIADALAKTMRVPLTLIQFRTVSSQLEADRPDGASSAEMDVFLDRLRSEGVNARARVYLCRDPFQALPLAFRQRSLIVLGGRRHWWPTRAERWRRALESQGHFVVFLDLSDDEEGGNPCR